MKAESEHLFRRGKRGILYLRKRIPLHLLDAYPRGKAEILVSLRTSDEDLAKQRLLETDDHLRQQGLDDDEFEELGERLVGQPKELWQLPARGQSQRLLPAMLNFSGSSPKTTRRARTVTSRTRRRFSDGIRRTRRRGATSRSPGRRAPI